MNTIPISICMIGKNEERFLEGCLEKLVPYGFEIIFTDTGSTDRTKEIARKYTEHVYDFVWCNDFSAARNFSASKAGNDWVIALDCDEYLEKADIGQLLSRLEENEQNVGSLIVNNLVRDGEAVGRTLRPVHRMYNRRFCHYEGMIHEQPRRLDGTLPVIFDTSIEVIHYGYSLSPEELKKKNERNIELLLEELKQNPNEPYYYFQLGQSYAILHENEKEFEVLHKGLELGPDPDQEYVQMMLMDYGNAMLKTERYELALNMESMQEILGEYSDYLYMMGRIYYANKQLLKALQTFMKATMASKTIVVGTNSFFPLNHMAVIYDNIGETQLAKQCREQVEELVKQFKVD